VTTIVKVRMKRIVFDELMVLFFLVCVSWFGTTVCGAHQFHSETIENCSLFSQDFFNTHRWRTADLRLQIGLYTQIRGQSRFFHGSLLAKGSSFRHFGSAQVPRDRFPECLPEVPGAVIPHAGICERGGVGQPVFLH